MATKAPQKAEVAYDPAVALDFFKSAGKPETFAGGAKIFSAQPPQSIGGRTAAPLAAGRKVSTGVTGVDRREVNGRFDARLERVGCHLERSREVGEAAAHLRDHEVARHEPQPGVGQIELPDSRGRNLDPL